MWPYLNRIYNHTDHSIVTATAECVRLAIANVVASGGQERESDVLVRRQPFRHDAPAEVSFPELQPLDTFAATDARLSWRGRWARHGEGEPLMRSDTPGDALEVTFRGNVIYVQGDIHCTCGVLEAWIDGALVQERDLYHPKQWANACQCTAVWVTGLGGTASTVWRFASLGARTRPARAWALRSDGWSPTPDGSRSCPRGAAEALPPRPQSLLFFLETTSQALCGTRSKPMCRA